MTIDNDDLRMLRKRPDVNAGAQPTGPRDRALNKSWIAAGALVLAIGLPQLLPLVTVDLVVESLAGAALFFYLTWKILPRLTKRRRRLVVLWHVAGIALTASLASIARLALGFVVGGAAIVRPTEEVGVLVTIVFPLVIAAVVAATLYRFVATEDA